MQCSYLPRDVVGAIIDSDAWVEALRPHRDEDNKNKLTPFRMMIQKMPGTLILMFVNCVKFITPLYEVMNEVLHGVMYRENLIQLLLSTRLSVIPSSMLSDQIIN